MVSRAYYLHQAQTCMSLAQVCSDPQLKRRYEDLAVEFAEKVNGGGAYLALAMPAVSPGKAAGTSSR